MNRLFLSAVAGAAAIASAAPASAQIYGGAGLAMLRSDLTPDMETGYFGSFGRAGFKFNPFVSLEGEIYSPVTHGSARHYANIYLPGTEYEVGLQSEYGAFVAGWIPIPFVGELFARAGVVQASVITSMSGAREDSSGYAYGGGAQVALWMVRLRGEFTRYEVDVGTIDSLAGSVLLQF